MTDDMEERLREALRERARVPVAAGDPVAGVENRMRRRARQRGIAVGSVAALCVAAIAIAATALAGNDTSSRPIGPAVSSSSPAPTPSQSATRSSTSAEATAPAVSLPATPATPIATTPLPPNVSSLTLPVGYEFGGLTTDSGPLLVTGTIPLPSKDITPRCAAVSIGGHPPAVAATTTSDCDDPVTAGEHVTMVITEKTDAHSDSGVSGTIAISHRNSASAGFTVGPVIMKYTAASNTRPVAAYGGGSLWIYDLDTNNGPEAVQVSATTGQVQDVVRTLPLSRPIMAANADGLWLGNSIEGSIVAGTVFHVAPRSHVAIAVAPSATEAVDWLVADNGHVWAGIRPSTVSGVLSVWRFDGPTATVAFRTPEPTLEVGPNFVVGDELNGLWLTTPDPLLGDTPNPTANQHLDVVRLDPDSGKAKLEATLPQSLNQVDAESQTAVGQAAFSQGNYFLLQSPSVGGYTGFTQLLSVTPLA